MRKAQDILATVPKGARKNMTKRLFDLLDKTREYYGIPKNGEIIYFESGLTVYQAKVIECVEDNFGTYTRASAGGNDKR